MEIKSDTYFNNKKQDCLAAFDATEDFTEYEQNPKFIIVENVIDENVFYIENEHSDISLKDLWDYPSFKSYPKGRVIIGYWKIKYKIPNNDYPLSA